MLVYCIMSLLDELEISVDFTKIKINDDKLESLASSLIQLKKNQKGLEWIDDDYWLPKKESDEAVSQFITLGNSINFKYWTKNEKIVYCAGKKGGIQARGAMYMWRCLLTCHNNQIFDILDAKKLSKITFEKFKEIFQDDSGNDVLPSLQIRHQNWIDLATKLEHSFNGKTLNIIKECNSSLIKFTNSFRKFKAFDDPMSKMIMVNAIMHQGRGLIKFDKPIIPGMDYQLLKQLLRQGVINAPSDIEEKIKNYKILDNKDAMELRKAGLFVLHKIMNKTEISGDYIDNMIWGNRTKCEDEKPVCVTSREEECPFHKFCSKKTELMIPLEDTRYY